MNAKVLLSWRVALLSIVAGILAGVYCHWFLLHDLQEPIARDFTWHWLAGRSVLDGLSPYLTVVPGGVHNLNAGYLYPAWTAVLLSPFSLLEPVVAASVFAGVSVALLTFGILTTERGRWPMIGSIPLFWAVSSGQLSILSTAAVLLPGMGWLALLKPNLALAMLAYKPSQSMIFGGVILAAMVPLGWHSEWLSVMANRTAGNYVSPLSVLGGPLMLLAVTRWKRPEARLLMVMALIPQSFLFYDQLPLFLVAKSRLESMALLVLAFAGHAVATMMIPAGLSTAEVSRIYAPAIMLCLYLPCLVMVLRRPNEGALPSWLHRQRLVEVTA